MAWGVLPIRATSGHNGGTGWTDPPARAKSAVADYAENLDRQAWIDRVQLYGGDAELMGAHAAKGKGS